MIADEEDGRRSVGVDGRGSVPSEEVWRQVVTPLLNMAKPPRVFS